MPNMCCIAIRTVPMLYRTPACSHCADEAMGSFKNSRPLVFGPTSRPARTSHCTKARSAICAPISLSCCRQQAVELLDLQAQDSIR